MLINELIDNAYLENEVIEYKEKIEEGKNKDGKLLEINWLKTLVAFGNTNGGTLIIGVENSTHKVVPLDQKQADKTILIIHNQIKNRINPMLDYEISTVTIKNDSDPRFIILVKVKKSKNLPISLHDNGLLGIYIRNFGRTDLATQEQIKDMILMSDNTPFDVTFTEEIYNENDYKFLHNFLSSKSIKLDEKLLISKGFINKDRKLSKGALLFKDNCSNDISKITMTQWDGTNKGGDIIKANDEFIGNLLIGLEKAQAFIKNHSINGFKKEDKGRVEYYSYPTRSISEGLVNAIAHRNYYIQGSQIEINIFDDRLEISSPGSLLGVRELHNEKRISSIIPRRRNEVICSILEICKLMEDRGSSFDKIESDYSIYEEKYKPFVSSDSSSFTLTLPDLTYKNGIVSSIDSAPNIYVETALSGKNDLKILSYCYNFPRTIKEIADFLNITPSTYFRTTVLAKLINSDLLKYTNVNNHKKLAANKNKVFLK